MNFSNKTRGYSLIEIIVVIGIMASLTAIIYSSFDGSKANSRDQKRVSDISNIQLALEQYFNKHGVYPLKLSGLVTPPDLSTGEKPYIGSLPAIAKSGDVPYDVTYFPMTKQQGTPNCITYQLWTVFERNNVYLDSKKNFNSSDKNNLPNNLYECVGSALDEKNRQGINPQSDQFIYDVMP
jgi:prepilin-type N-terminal cleavage/methylation domain-containing protein